MFAGRNAVSLSCFGGEGQGEEVVALNLPANQILQPEFTPFPDRRALQRRSQLSGLPNKVIGQRLEKSTARELPDTTGATE